MTYSNYRTFVKITVPSVFQYGYPGDTVEHGCTRTGTQRVFYVADDKASQVVGFFFSKSVMKVL
jgi:hypothetical protein